MPGGQKKKTTTGEKKRKKRSGKDNLHPHRTNWYKRKKVGEEKGGGRKGGCFSLNRAVVRGEGGRHRGNWPTPNGRSPNARVVKEKRKIKKKKKAA